MALLTVMALGFTACSGTPGDIPSPSPSNPVTMPTTSPAPSLNGSDLELAIIDALDEFRPGYYGVAHQPDDTVKVTVSEPHDDLSDADLEQLRMIAQRLTGDRKVTITRGGPPPSEEAS